MQLLTREQSPSFVAAVPMRAQCGWEASIGPAGALQAAGLPHTDRRTSVVWLRVSIFILLST